MDMAEQLGAPGRAVHRDLDQGPAAR